MINKSRLKLIKKELNKYPLFSYLDRGKRGEIYKLNNNLIVKIERDDIKVKGTIKNEYYFSKKIEKYSFFPKIIDYNNKLRYLIKEYVKGKKIARVKLNNYKIKRILKLAWILDKNRINQKELTNPFKHIFFNGKKIMMIDFEKARLNYKPKNLSQITQYLCKKLKINPKKIIRLTKDYKKNYSKKNLNKIIQFFILNNI